MSNIIKQLQNQNWIDCPDCCDACAGDGYAEFPSYGGMGKEFAETCQQCDGEPCSTCEGNGRIVASDGIGY